MVLISAVENISELIFWGWLKFADTAVLLFMPMAEVSGAAVCSC